MKVSEVMTRDVQTVGPDQRVQDAASFMLSADAGSIPVTDGDRLIGMFRAHGLVTPVWDLPVGTGAAALEEPTVRLRAALESAIATDAPLTSDERAARAGLASRQLTIR